MAMLKDLDGKNVLEVAEGDTSGATKNTFGVLLFLSVAFFVK